MAGGPCLANPLPATAAQTHSGFRAPELFAKKERAHSPGTVLSLGCLATL
jgi:hypothetical protein